MGVFTSEIKINTNSEVDIIDNTDNLQKVVKDSKINNGIICVFIPGSTGTITTIEYEPGLQKDFPRVLEKIAPKKGYYAHHETWNDDNVHSHVRVSLMGSSITLPICNKKIVHGTWQQIVFVELDTKPRTRNLIVQIVGD